MIGRLATFDSSSVRLPCQDGSTKPGGRVDQQPQPAQRALALEPRDEVVRQGDRLERLPEHELARVQDERLLAGTSTSSVSPSIGSRTSMYG